MRFRNISSVSVALYLTSTLVTSSDALGQCNGRWLTPFGGGGPTGIVQAAVVWDPDGNGPRPRELVVGGRFSSVGGVSASNIAAWNGERWSPLGSGVPGSSSEPVHSLVVHGGLLFVAGSFPNLPDLPNDTIDSIAAWDGDRWIAVPPLSGAFAGTNVEAMISFQGELIIGGDIDRAGSTVVSNVAAWNGSTWRAMGTLGNSASTPRSFAVFQGSLYAGGAFDGGYRHVARWNGTAWQTVGGGIDDADTYVDSLLTWNGKLYAGGQFFDSNVPFRDLASWNGSVWSGFAENVQGTTARINSLGEYRGDLVIGGGFTTVGGSTSNAIARWNGTSWRGFSTGVAGCTGGLCRTSVLGYAVYNDELIVVGNFLSAGGISSPYIARWSESGVPWVRQNPVVTFSGQGRDVTVTAAAAPGYDFAGPLSYQWLRNGVPVIDGPRGDSPTDDVVSGARTPTLRISELPRSDSGSYQLQIGNSCGFVTSAAVTLQCSADYNEDGGVDGADVGAFFVDWGAGLSDADINADGGIDGADVEIFFIIWSAGSCD
jgi:hypothetical protein